MNGDGQLIFTAVQNTPGMPLCLGSNSVPRWLGSLEWACQSHTSILKVPDMVKQVLKISYYPGQVILVTLTDDGQATLQSSLSMLTSLR